LDGETNSLFRELQNALTKEVFKSVPTYCMARLRNTIRIKLGKGPGETITTTGADHREEIK
jgi:hypothetical protein